MTSFLLVFLGGGLGSMARYGVNVLCMRWFTAQYPWATFSVNVLGSFLMGVFAGYLTYKATQSWSGGARLFLMTGVLGGFTTFSAFSLDVMSLLERGDFGAAALYVIASVVVSLFALSLGLGLIRWFA